MAAGIDSSLGAEVIARVVESPQSSDEDGSDKDTDQLYNDPIHGTIQLHPLLHKVINTPEFNRLKDIKQLGGLYYVYPGATHSRFEHSIGVCYIAGQFVRMLKQNQPNELCISDKDILCVELAALCHDLGHGPFSHMFEKGVNKMEEKWFTAQQEWKHETLSQKIFRRIFEQSVKVFKQYGLGETEVELICEMICYDRTSITKCPDPENKFLYEIVANEETGLDVDKWDYFARDCHYIGITNPFNWRRCMNLSRVIEEKPGEKHICFRDKEVFSIYEMFRTRSHLHSQAYQHKTGVAVEHMMMEAIRLAGNSGVKLLLTGDANAGMTIEEVVKAAADEDKLDGFLALTDSILQLIKNANPHTCSEEGKKENLKKAQTLLQKLEKRDIFHLVHTEQWDNLKDVDGFDEKNMLQQLAEKTGEKADNMFIKKVTISYGAKIPSDDPVKAVRFYSKRDQDKIIEKGEIEPRVPDLIIPRAFHERQVRVYWMKGVYEEGHAEVSKDDTTTKQEIVRVFKELFVK